MIHITINGTVDAKRLERAFQEALNRFLDYHGDNFDSFYKAEIFLSAKGKDGDDVYIREAFSTLEFPVPLGEEIKMQDHDESNNDEDEFFMSDEDYREKYRLEIQEYQMEQQKLRDEMMLLQADQDSQFKLILNRLGDGILDEFNSMIKAVWEEQKPIVPNGKRKGQISFMPFFKIDNKRVRSLRLVTSSSNLAGKGILNPIAVVSWDKKLVPVHDTVIWCEHVQPRLEKIMDDYLIAASTN